MSEEVIRQDIIEVAFNIDTKSLDLLHTNLDMSLKSAENNLGGIGTNLEKLGDDFKNTAKSADVLQISLTEAGETGLAEEVDKTATKAEALGKYFGYVANMNFDDELKAIATNLTPLKSGIDKVSDSVLKVAKNAAGKGYEGLKKMAGVSFKTLVAGIAGISAATVASVKGYADYEQFIGGVETLFKESASTVMKNANDAYKNVGLSANNYMDTVTSFSASLISSLGNDTKKSAEYADLAITDMADNANKMGSSMENIQNAYQGFAKQNYAMLDNLKIGYGGTKTEMERLIKDAAALDKSGLVKADNLDFGNIVQAIHVIQTNMGITGTTSKEAATTISGSLASMKSAWGNLLVSFVTGGDFYDQCIANMIDSTKTFLNNAIPAGKKAFKGIGTLVVEGIQTVAANMPEISTYISSVFAEVFEKAGEVIPTVLPSMASGVATLVKGIGELIIKNKVTIINKVSELATTVIKALYEGFTGAKMNDSVFRNIMNTMQDIMKTAVSVGQFVVKNIKPIAGIITGIVIASASWKVVMTACNTVLKIQAGLQKAKATIDAVASAKTKISTALTLKKAAATATETAATKAATSATKLGAVAQTILNTAMKACPVIAIVAGVLALATAVKKITRLITGYNKTLKENSKRISTNVANIKDFKTAVDNCESTLADYNTLLSTNGNLMSDIDSKISDTETSITNIWAVALQNQSKLRESDLEDVRGYLDQLKALEAEKLSIYQGQQDSVIAETKLRIESGGMNSDEMAQMVANSKTALNDTISAISANLQTEKTNIENLYKTGGISQEEYNTAINNANAESEQQIQTAKDKHNELLTIIAQTNSDLAAKNSEAWKKLSEIGKTYQSQSSTLLGWIDKDTSTTAYSNWLSGINDDSLTVANNFLSSAAEIKENGGALTEEMKTQIDSMLSAFDNVPKDCSEDAKNVVLGMIGGMAEEIPALSDTTEMSAKEIVDTFRTYLGIHSPSTVMQGLGVYVGQGLISGIESKISNLTTSGKNMVNGLIKGVNSKKTAAVNAAKEIANAINEEFDRVQVIGSPSKLWAEKGGYLIEGLTIGLEKGKASVQNVSEDIGNIATPYIKKQLLPVYSGVNSTVTKTSTSENITYSPAISINVEGGATNRQTARAVKAAAKEAIKEMMDSFSNGNKPVRES